MTLRRLSNRIVPIADAGLLRQAINGGPAFDPDWYREQTSSAAARFDPLLHYLMWGSRRGLMPVRGFDPDFYRGSNPDVGLNGFEPFTHYAVRGWREGRETSADGLPSGDLTSPAQAPTPSEWAALPAPDPRAPAVDVVIPIFAGRDETLRCLHSALVTRGETPFRLVAVNDATPDPTIAHRLAMLAETGQIKLLTNQSNRGFVVSANRGMALHPERDIVLLNADTQVYGDWLDRLRLRADRSGGTGTVTPWSNDATILSYPIRLRPNGMALEISDARLDRIASGLQLSEVALPTAVGFCMYIKRACLQQVGPFDEQHFGRGYGEENDFCRRAARFGWTHLAATDVFVRHHGGRSFGAEKRERIRAALAVMARLHPNYLGLVRRFNATDPLQPSRQAFDEARIRAAAPFNILSDTCSIAAATLPEAGIVLAFPGAGPTYRCFELASLRVPVTPNVPPLAAGLPQKLLRERIAALGIRAVQVSDRRTALTMWLRSVARRCELPLFERDAIPMAGVTG